MIFFGIIIFTVAAVLIFLGIMFLIGHPVLLQLNYQEIGEEERKHFEIRIGVLFLICASIMVASGVLELLDKIGIIIFILILLVDLLILLIMLSIFTKKAKITKKKK